MDLFVTRTEWISEMALNGGAVAKKLGNLGVIGVDYVSIDYGQLIGTQVASNTKGYIETGDVDVGAFAVGFGYARQFTDKYHLGAHIKYASQHLGSNILRPDGEEIENRVSGVAYDIGTIFYPGFKSFRLGMSIRDFSPQFKYEETAFQLPLTFRIGFAMNVLDLVGGIPNNSLLISVDALHPRDYTERVHVGGEYSFGNLIALRAGYKTNYDEEGLSLGFGVNYEIAGIALRIDYAYTDFGVFNSVNRFTVGGSF
ncbi:MAG TPA: PorV/PorQ family protein [bacterium]|nr:PorV/PorQ family protein [bacterium]